MDAHDKWKKRVDESLEELLKCLAIEPVPKRGFTHAEPQLVTFRAERCTFTGNIQLYWRFFFIVFNLSTRPFLFQATKLGVEHT